jgi:hypothetical protein
MKITREMIDNMIQFPYTNEFIADDQLVMYTIIMVGLKNEGSKTFSLNDRLRELNYSSFDYLEGYIDMNDTVDIIAIITGKFGDLKSVQFHLIPEVFEVDFGQIDRTYDVEELDVFIECAIKMFKKGISSSSRYLTKDLRSAISKILSVDIQTYEDRLGRLRNSMLNFNDETPRVMIQDTEYKIQKLERNIEQSRENIEIINYVEEQNSKLFS